MDFKLKDQKAVMLKVKAQVINPEKWHKDGPKPSLIPQFPIES